MIEVFYACFVLFALGIGLRMSLRLLYGARGPHVGDPVYLMMNVLGWMLILIPIFGLSLIGTTFLSPLILLIGLMAIVEWVLARRELQRQCIWALLNGRVGEGGNSVELLHAQQSRFTGIVGRAFHRLVRSMEDGADMATAIADNPGAVPRQALPLVAIGAFGHDKSKAVQETVLQQQNSTSEATQTLAFQQIYQRAAYLFSILIVMGGALTFLMIWIVPSFESIFADFELELPQSTKLLIDLASSPLTLAIRIVVGFAIAFVSLLILAIAVCYLLDFQVLRPFTDRLFFSRHRAAVLRLLSLAAQSKLPLPKVLQQLSFGEQPYPSPLARRRLRRAFLALNDGVDWKDALCEASIIDKPDYPMLETGQQAGNLPWVLSMLAGQKERSMVHRWVAAEQIVFPLVILAIGMCVFFVCVSLFTPLVNLIHGLA